MTLLKLTAERCFALAMRAVPRPYRLKTSLLLARATVPLFGWTRAYREQRIKNFHRADEIVLYLLLNALTKNGTVFDVEIVTSGYEHFERAYAQGKGVLIIGHHAALTLLMVRLFHDKDLNPIVVTPDPHLRAMGTLVTVETIQRSPMFLVQLRTKLRHGALICAMPDRGEHHAGRTIEFETAAGAVILAPAMIEVAARCRAEVVFTEVRMKDGQIVTNIAAPSASSAGNAAAIIEDFISFVRGCTAQALPSGQTQDVKIEAKPSALAPLRQKLLSTRAGRN